MAERLRDDLDALEVAVAAVAEATGIPAAHVEKDFWLTEALRGVAAAADRLGVPVYFKGGTSLSKVFGLIRRFSEDVDLLAVLRADDSPRTRHRVLKQLCAGAVDATGLEETPVGDKSSKGERRAITLAYPITQSNDSTRPALRTTHAAGGASEEDCGFEGGFAHPRRQHAYFVGAVMPSARSELRDARRWRSRHRVHLLRPR